MSLILGIDTSSSALSVGLVDNGSVITHCFRSLHQSHAEHIALSVRYILSSANIQPHEIRKAAIVIGPGSFTGLRIGIAFVKGFFLSTNIPIVPVSSLLASAYASMDLSRGNPLSILFASSQNRVFYNRFIVEHGYPTQKNPDTVMDVEECIQQIQKDDVILYDPVTMLHAPIASRLNDIRGGINLSTRFLNRGTAAALLAHQGDGSLLPSISTVDLEPMYLQSSYGIS